MKQPMFFIYVVIDITGMNVGESESCAISLNHCHLSHTDALNEASKLAIQYPGRTFAVFHSGMAVTAKVQKPKVHLLSKSQFKKKKEAWEP